MSAESRFRLTATCEAGHTQTMLLAGVTREWAESYAGLLDGTSPMYVFPPGPDDPGVIGKCGYPGENGAVLCGKPFKCTVEEAPPNGFEAGILPP